MTLLEASHLHVNQRHLAQLLRYVETTDL